VIATDWGHTSIIDHDPITVIRDIPGRRLVSQARTCSEVMMNLRPSLPTSYITEEILTRSKPHLLLANASHPAPTMYSLYKQYKMDLGDAPRLALT
jgi:hypothetical protein